MIQTAFVLAAVVFLANITLRMAGKKLKGKAGSIEVLERVQVSQGSSIAIVRIAGRLYAMSLTDKGSSILRELDEEEESLVLKNLEDRPQPPELKNLAKAFLEKRMER